MVLGNRSELQSWPKYIANNSLAFHHFSEIKVQARIYCFANNRSYVNPRSKSGHLGVELSGVHFLIVPA